MSPSDNTQHPPQSIDLSQGAEQPIGQLGDGPSPNTRTIAINTPAELASAMQVAMASRDFTISAFPALSSFERFDAAICQAAGSILMAAIDENIPDEHIVSHMALMETRAFSILTIITRNNVDTVQKELLRIKAEKFWGMDLQPIDKASSPDTGVPEMPTETPSGD